MKRRLCGWALAAFLFILSAGCAGTVYVDKAPPPPKQEAKPAKPGPKAVWMSGHWEWKGGRYVWKSGHWVRNAKGKTWVAGHWDKRGKRYVWVKGHWK